MKDDFITANFRTSALVEDQYNIGKILKLPDLDCNLHYNPA